MRDAYADSGFGPTITYIDNRFYFHIDQIFYRGDMRAVDIVRGDIKSSEPLSDDCHIRMECS